MRTTIKFNDKVYKALKIHAAETGESLSTLVEEAVMYQLLEDADDIKTANRRAKELLLPFDKLVKEFKAEGLL
jgi:hypothetical protein